MLLPCEYYHIRVLLKKSPAIVTKRLNPEIAHQRVENLINAWNHEIKEIMGGMGINSIDSLRGNRLMLRGIGLTEKELSDVH